MIHFVLGGARSGKSRFAQNLVEAMAGNTVYIATATEIDGEMSQRIRRHQQDRPSHWATIECPTKLAQLFENELTFEQENPPSCPQNILIDCITLWVNNVLYQASQKQLENEDLDTYMQQCIDGLCLAIGAFTKRQQGLGNDVNVVIVSNEVGLGIIPLGQVSRQFVDYAGWANQALACLADRVDFIAAGLPLSLKSIEK